MARRSYRPADSHSVLKAPFLRRLELLPEKLREGLRDPRGYVAAALSDAEEEEAEE
jgi:hypothetical protein